MAKILLIFLSIIFLQGCTSLFYHPDSVLYDNPQLRGIDMVLVKFNSADKTQLVGWWLKNKQKLDKPKGLILFFHGNAQNMSSHYLALEWVLQEGWDLFVFDYRGYGLSEGKPTPEGVSQDAFAALEWAYGLKKRMGHEKFVIYGQSLGGTIALDLMTSLLEQDKVQLLALDGTFSSYKEIAGYKVPGLGSWLVSDEHSPKKNIKNLKSTPVLVIHGEKDPVIPFKFGKEIYDQLVTPHKWFLTHQGGHNETFTVENQRLRAEFLKLINADKQSL